MSIDARALRADRFAEIGIVIQRDAGLIIDRWTHRAVQEQPQARRVHYQVLLDELPDFLAELGRGLTEAGDPFNCPEYRPALKHGEQRWQSGWSLSEVIRDYQILRLMVLDYLDETLDRSLRLREIMAVGLALDEAIATSVSRYLEFCDEQARRQTESLRDADRRKNEFLAILAHELRNPLAPMRNSVEIMRLDGGDSTIVKQVCGIMDRQVTQMARLVDDLLDMSRIALGKLMLRREQLDLRAALTQAVQMSAPLGEARRHQLSVDLPAEPLWVTGDQTRLVQVFVNLLNNAVKYTPPGGRLGVEAKRDGSEAVVRVTDSGIGIPGEMLARIFELFTQVETGSDRSQGGLGIGLSLVRRLVEMHNGTIAVHSGGRNLGSEFVVSLPVADAVTSDRSKGPEEVPVATGRRILLIEDNADGRRSLALLLKLAGHEVTASEDAQRGLGAAQAARFDVALIDIGLPDTDGYEVASQLRTTLGKSIYLVALTGFSQPEDRQRAIDAGFDAHLTKPVSLTTLQQVLAGMPSGL